MRVTKNSMYVEYYLAVSLKVKQILEVLPTKYRVLNRKSG